MDNQDPPRPWLVLVLVLRLWLRLRRWLWLWLRLWPTNHHRRHQLIQPILRGELPPSLARLALAEVIPALALLRILAAPAGRHRGWVVHRHRGRF